MALPDVFSVTLNVFYLTQWEMVVVPQNKTGSWNALAPRSHHHIDDNNDESTALEAGTTNHPHRILPDKTKILVYSAATRATAARNHITLG